MTDQFKKGMEAIIRGGSIANIGNGKYRVRDREARPVLSVRYSTFISYSRHCRKRGNVWVLNKKKILSYHGKSWVKKTYKVCRDQALIEKSERDLTKIINSFPTTIGFTCEPCVVESATPVQIDRQELYDHLGKLLHLYNTN